MKIETAKGFLATGQAEPDTGITTAMLFIPQSIVYGIEGYILGLSVQSLTTVPNYFFWF
jgi:hypothetical protein